MKQMKSQECSWKIFEAFVEGSFGCRFYIFSLCDFHADRQTACVPASPTDRSCSAAGHTGHIEKKSVNLVKMAL